MTNKDR